MQKIRIKPNANVGVDAHIDPLKQNKGLTLIALIITIIVMLILVGVTINVALNGGIFDWAQEAKNRTAQEVAKEKVLSCLEFTNSRKSRFK